MERVLNYLLTLTPRQVLVRLWLLLLTGAAISGIRLLSGVASAVCIIVLVGYSHVVVLGASSSSPVVKRFGRLLCAVLGVFALAMSIIMPFLELRGVDSSLSAEGWIGLAIALPVNIAVFVPFFLATHVISDVRRAKGVYKTFDFFPTFLALYFGWFGGIIYAHRLVRESFPNASSQHSAGGNGG